MSAFISNIIHLFSQQLKLEWKSPFIIGGNLLYVIGAVFITYKIFNEISAPVWVCVFWLIFLFTALNSTIHSFSREQSDSILFYYSFTNPVVLYLSRVIFNFFFLMISAGLLSFFMGLFLRNPIVDHGLFFIAMVLSGLGFSIQFTFVSAIAVHTQQSNTMTSILGLPLIIPILMTAVKLTLISAEVIIDDGSDIDIMILSAIDMIMFGIAVILFPSLWRS